MDLASSWSIRLMYSEPSFEVQLLEVVLIATAFQVILPASGRYLSQKFKRRPWYDHAASLMGDSLKNMLLLDEVSDEMLDKCMGDMIPLMAQHFFGGMLCAPAIFGLGVPRAAAVALARHGALVELGWELQDTAQRLYERFFTAQGSKLHPNGMFFFLAMHHAMQWALVIPMNLYYSEVSGYHELVFMLEGAAGFAGGAMFYGYTLDVSKRSELRQMVVLNALGFVVMVYTRFVHYWWSVFKCLQAFFLEGSYVVLSVGVICGIFMMPYVACMFVPDQWGKLKKFTRLYLAAQVASAECSTSAVGSVTTGDELPALIKSSAMVPLKKHAD